MGLTTTEDRCFWCHEDENREDQFLVELPLVTARLRLKVRVCPHCDGAEIMRLSQIPR